MTRTKLNIFSYTDYRQFLHDRLSELKDENPKFSRRYICNRLGLASNNYMKLVIDGSRNLSDALSRRLTKVLGLDDEEATFFHNLVAFGQAKTTEAKSEALETLRRNKRFLKVHQLALDEFDYFADPVTLALRDIVALDDFKEDASWIVNKLAFKSSPQKVRTSLQKLERLGQLVRDSSGRLQVAHAHQSTGNQLGSVPLRSYHLKMLEMAGEAMELPVDVRHFRGMTMSIPTEAYDEIASELAGCMDRVRAIIDRYPTTEHIYHLEMALFPLTKREANDETATQAE